MARYRVQGPDGATHVFEGPDGATPEQVTAFAAQTFGGKAPAPATAPQPDYSPDDPGALGAALIGAGRTTDKVLKGMQQLYYGAKAKFETPTLSELVSGRTPSQVKLDELASQVAENDRLNKPLIARHPVASAIGESLPALAVPVGGGATLAGTAGRLALAGALPGALEYGSAGERAGAALSGGVAGVVGGVVVPKALQAAARFIPAVGRTARAIVEPLTENGRTAIAGRTLNAAAGEDAAGATQRLANATQLVPGSAPTAAQVAENGGIAALERSVSARQPADFTTRGMEQASARLQALRSVAGDDASMAAAKAARQSTAGPMFEQAKRANYTVDPQLQELLGRPAMKQALSKAEALAANNGRRFAFDVPALNTFAGVGAPGQASRQVTGQGLQDLKMAIDAMLSDPASGFAGKAGDAIKGQRGQLLDWMERANPEFKAARTTYANMSRPINQMQVGQELLGRIEPALNDYGQLGAETGAKYALALRNAEQTARKATDFKGMGLSQMMEPEQMSLLEGIAADLARKSNAQNLGRGAGSNTFQNLAMDNIAGQSGAPRVLGAALNAPGVSKVAKFLYAGPEQQIQSQLAQAFLNPQLAATLMQRNATASRVPVKDLLLAKPGAVTSIGGGLGGLSIADYFSQP